MQMFSLKRVLTALTSLSISILVIYLRNSLRRVRELMIENTRRQEILRQLELESLYNQIKPHFIYNTLDLIIGQLESHNSETASSLVESLGSFFRLTLGRGQEMVPIASELEHVRNYLFIQQFRYGGEYQYQINIEEPGLLRSFMPRFLLQPLVENALYHGVLPNGGKGTISICIDQSGDEVLVEVSDDGVGISQKKLLAINTSLKVVVDKDITEPSSGLQGVNRRAKLMFGDEYGVELESTPGSGTTARLRIRHYRANEPCMAVLETYSEAAFVRDAKQH